jgi:hypothetical protein
MIDFTTTATIRPELLEITYESFSKNFDGIDLKKSRLFINVDPAPEDSLNLREAVVETAKKFFGEVVHNFPSSPNFPLALRWAWTNTSTEYVFNLEDDWILTEKVDINDIINILKKRSYSIGVSLNAYVFGKDVNRIRLSPCLIRGGWAREAASYLQEKICPEQQLRKTIPIDLRKPMLNYPDYQNPREGKVIVKDTGREWRKTRKLERNVDPIEGFVRWKKTE